MELIKDKTMRARLGKAGRARVLADYSGEEERVRLWVQTYKVKFSGIKNPRRKIRAAPPRTNGSLFVSTVGYTIEAFLLPYVDVFVKKGYNVVAFANWKFHWDKLPPYVAKADCPFSRRAISFSNVLAFLG